MPPLPSPGRLSALAASLRIPNLPSVWSNTLTGALLTCLVIGNGELVRALPALIASTCLYLAGNLLNDWSDRAWDHVHRPERALPRRLFRPGHYLASALLLTCTGLGAAATVGIPALMTALGLVACILLYTWLHKRTAWSSIPMALCRALLPVLGFSACINSTIKLQWALVPASLLFVYLIMLSLRARTESSGKTGPLLTVLTGVGLLAPPLMLGAFWYFPHSWLDALLACMAAAVPYLIWIALTLSMHRRPVSRQISALLAGIPLLDGLFLLPYVIMGNLLIPYDSSGLAVCFTWAGAFFLGHLLQRSVPAT